MSIYNDIDLEEQYDKIYRYCYFKLKNQQVAEDITQETFLRFLESETYRSTGKVLRYLYTVARNLCIDEYRRRQKENLIEEFTENIKEAAGRLSKLNDEACAEEHWVNTIAVKNALEELSEEERELILLRYVNEVPVSVICKLFGLSRFAVYRRTKAVIEILHHSVGVMAIMAGGLFAARLVSMPASWGFISQLWNYIPINLLKIDQGFTDLRLVSVFGVWLTSWQFAPILYVIIIVAAGLIGSRMYIKYQVSGR